MIIFHEGLPGSGKSYEAVVHHIIPSIKKGRHVYARLNGFNAEKVAEIIGETVDYVSSLYTEITEEQVLEVYKYVKNDSLLVIDELQNFFPSGRQKLSDEMTQFIAEHRHKGMDILCMGQALADVHTTWKRRVERKIVFLKLSMVGLDKRYKWKMYQGVLSGKKSDIEFKEIKSGTKSYDSQYFGSYLSHQQGTDNTDVYNDDRVNVLKSNAIKIYLPAFIFVLIFAVWFLYGLFTGSESVVSDNKSSSDIVRHDKPAPTQQQGQSSTARSKPPVRKVSTDVKQRQRDIIENSPAYVTYSEIYRNQVSELLLVVYDDLGQVIDRYDRDSLLVLGYRLKNSRLGIMAYYNNQLVALFRYKPSGDYFKQIPDDTYSDLRASN
ncbi:zonular occludens toxin domain-containing protein [Pseudoalteromonas sp. McH1-42]|uniref:zonular occludens toxin domain-containing protein n=1 Tax=Pseudoalteromonas sp. McH1-42 TaxID=2917752 RepID=UPI001EF64A81|nr:zonular occludens toxin domain-containing protein [Pseudoalteromonas sp. McH1-42]MCG7563337.1 zonular occludens toxin domain-containing protein [Pseudoalteromonas sp. McH1-42]